MAIRVWQSINYQASFRGSRKEEFLLRGVMSNPAMMGGITEARG